MGGRRPNPLPARQLTARSRRGAATEFTALRFEPLEERLLLHAGHEHDAPTHDPQIAELLGYFPAADDAAPLEGATALNPLSSIPALNSFPGAADSLYLDFDGFFEPTWGEYDNINTPVFDQDGDPTTFSDAELTTIQNVWARVAEDYAPFKINVTTVVPPNFADGVALRVAIGGDGSWTGGNYGGIAYINSYTNFTIPNTVYVFPENLSNGYAKYVAEASSHEAGHAYGLRHQSQYNASGQKIAEYYSGPGDGRAPIMGNSYSATRGLWWYGTSTSATTFQDDLALISRPANTFGYRTDDHGNTAGTATPLSGSGVLQATGIITQTTDVDYFSFDAEDGETTLLVDVPAGINNLDSRLELRTAGGALIASAAPAGSFGANIVTTLAAGSYRAVVASQGSYGDIGQYTLTVNVPAAPAESLVVARHVFYNNSAFDGNDAAINAADASAIASDKTAYLPGTGQAVLANLTNFDKGITGIVVDLVGGGNHAAIGAGDFVFKVGTDNSPGSWAAAPTPNAVAVSLGGGDGGSDRVTITWAAGDITDRWLEVQVLANSNTGLATDDVHFWGNLVGETATSTPAGDFARTIAADGGAILANGTQSNVGITNTLDVNKSNSITLAADRGPIVALGTGTLARISVSAGGPFAPAAGDEQGGHYGDGAFALALSTVAGVEPREFGANGSGVAFSLGISGPAHASAPSVLAALAPRAEREMRSAPTAAAADAEIDAMRDLILGESIEEIVESAPNDALDALAEEIRRRIA
jgi:hypothetical protein